MEDTTRLLEFAVRAEEAIAQYAAIQPPFLDKESQAWLPGADGMILMALVDILKELKELKELAEIAESDRKARLSKI